MITRDEKRIERNKTLKILEKAKELEKNSKARWIRIDNRTIVKVQTELSDEEYRTEYYAKAREKLLIL